MLRGGLSTWLAWLDVWFQMKDASISQNSPGRSRILQYLEVLSQEKCRVRGSVPLHTQLSGEPGLDSRRGHGRHHLQEPWNSDGF